MMTCYSEKIMFHSQLEKKILNGIYPLLTNFTSVSREFSQTHTFSSIFVTDLVRSPVIGAIASCENQGQKITIDCVLVWHLTRNIHNFQHDIFDCWKFNCLNLIKETSIWSSLIKQCFIWKKKYVVNLKNRAGKNCFI